MQVETRHYDFYADAKKSHNVEEISELDEVILNIVKKEGFVSCDVIKKEIPADGGNYLGSLCEVDIKGKANDGDKETALFVKCITSNCEAMELISVPEVYQTELFVYKDLIPIFNKIQDEVNVPVDERYSAVKCYDESFGTTIIMENVKKKGFKTLHRMDVVSLSMAEESMKQLARFHALSFVLKEKKPNYFINKIKSLEYPVTFGKPWEEFAEKLINQGLEMLDENLRSKIDKRILGIALKMKDYYRDESLKHCLCHGDYRPNNIMVKEKNGIVTDIIPIDYQLIFHGCPVLDIIYFIYLCTDRQFRTAHMTYLKNVYYSSLDTFLGHFDMSAESVFPRKLFESLYNETLDYGLALTFLLVPFVFVSENDDIPDLKTQGVQNLDIKIDDRFKHRLTDAVEEMIDLGYL